MVFEEPWPYHLPHVDFVPELEDSSTVVTQLHFVTLVGG